MTFKFLIPLKFINAKLHLRYKCPNCLYKVRTKRDILRKGECYWFENWNNKTYDLPFYWYTLLEKKLKK